jgi:predicted MFS family arabinose efflux permease
MVGANMVRLIVFVGIGVAAAAGSLQIWILLALLLVVASCEVLFESTAQTFVPTLVEPTQLARADAWSFAAQIVAGSLAGLTIGALLFDVSPGLPFTTNALSFAIAAVLIALIRPRHELGGRITHRVDDRRFRSGVEWLRHHRPLRTLTIMFAITNLGLMFGQGIFVKYAIDELGLGAVEYGVLLAITAMGAATGGVLSSTVIPRLGLRASVVAPYLVFGGAQLVIGIASAVWMVASAAFVLGGAVTIWNVAILTIRQREIPGDRFGRVDAVYRSLAAAAGAIGAVAGGFVASSTNLRVPFLIGGAIALLAATLLARPAMTSLRER